MHKFRPSWVHAGQLTAGADSPDLQAGEKRELDDLLILINANLGFKIPNYNRISYLACVTHI